MFFSKIRKIFTKILQNRMLKCWYLKKQCFFSWFRTFSWWETILILFWKEIKILKKATKITLSFPDVKASFDLPAMLKNKGYIRRFLWLLLIDFGDDFGLVLLKVNKIASVVVKHSIAAYAKRSRHFRYENIVSSWYPVSSQKKGYISW